MLTGVYRTEGFFCNICRENPVIFTDYRKIPADIAGFPCRYCRFSLQILQVFPAYIADFPCRYCRKTLNHPVNLCKYLQWGTLTAWGIKFKWCAKSYTTVAFLFHPFLLLEKVESLIRWNMQTKCTRQCILHNSNLKIHGFWTKALKLHSFLKTKSL